MNRLDKIEARANAATEGPWEKSPRYKSDCGWTVPGVSAEVTEELVVEAVRDADAEFIAHARTDVPDMAAALRAVLEVHKEDGNGWEPGGSFCTECQQGYGLLVPYPCPTVEAIRRYLGDDL